MATQAHKLITCILPKGIAAEIVKQLKTEKNIVTANINSARGMGKLTPDAYRGVGEQTEKDILSVVVEAGEAEDIFSYLFEAADIDHPHGGIIYMTNLYLASRYLLPELPDED